MKKLVYVLVALMMASTVSAWHCIDTDEGAEGWFSIIDAGNHPEGCDNTAYWTGTCADVCLENNSIRDFSCEHRFPDRTGNTEMVIAWDDSGWCGPTNEIPEFTTIGAGLVLIGAGLYAYKKRK